MFVFEKQLTLLSTKVHRSTRRLVVRDTADADIDTFYGLGYYLLLFEHNALDII